MNLEAHILNLALHFQLSDMNLQQALKQAHQEVIAKKASGEHYRYKFTAAILPLIQEIYSIKLSQSEQLRFEKSLWYTVDLWRDSQGIANVGELLHIIQRFIEKFFKDKSNAGKIIQ